MGRKKRAIAMSLNNMTNAYLNTLSSCICRFEEDYKQIAVKFKQALKIQQEIGDRHGEACSLDNLGMTFRYLEKYSKSIEYHQKALKIRQCISELNGESSSLGNLGITYYDIGDYKRASELFKQSLSITRQIGNKHDEANSIYNLGNCWNKLGQMQKARSAYIDAKRIYQKLNLECNVQDCSRKIKLIDIKLKSINI
ncbi:MAG: tetratricopeptide repeat protein [Cyanobacteria bacterium P01_A01_bin.83]